jgi:hypothetical protein
LCDFDLSTGDAVDLYLDIVVELVLYAECASVWRDEAVLFGG